MKKTARKLNLYLWYGLSLATQAVIVFYIFLDISNIKRTVTLLTIWFVIIFLEIVGIKNRLYRKKQPPRPVRRVRRPPP